MPTNAQVGYHWLTSEARLDRSESARFLEATYVRPKTQTLSADGRRYGGFIVRVYFDGQLQDSRASPPNLLTLFPAEDHSPTPLPMRPPESLTVAVGARNDWPLSCSGSRCRLPATASYNWRPLTLSDHRDHPLSAPCRVRTGCYAHTDAANCGRARCYHLRGNRDRLKHSYC